MEREGNPLNLTTAVEEVLLLEQLGPKAILEQRCFKQ